MSDDLSEYSDCLGGFDLVAERQDNGTLKSPITGKPLSFIMWPLSVEYKGTVYNLERVKFGDNGHEEAQYM